MGEEDESIRHSEQVGGRKEPSPTNYHRRNNARTLTVAIRHVFGSRRPLFFWNQEEKENNIVLASTIRLVPFERSVERRNGVLFWVVEREPGEVRRPFSSPKTAAARSVLAPWRSDFFQNHEEENANVVLSTTRRERCEEDDERRSDGTIFFLLVLRVIFDKLALFPGKTQADRRLRRVRGQNFGITRTNNRSRGS